MNGAGFSTREHLIATMLFFVLAILLWGWVVYDALWFRLITYGARSDIWEHVAVLKEWSQNIWEPQHPHTQAMAGSPRYTPLYMIYAILYGLGGLGSLDVVAFAGVLHTTVLLIALYFFCYRYFESPWAPVVALVVLFCFWGQGWGWANAYDLRAYLLVSSYPSMGVFAFSVMLFAWTLRLLRSVQRLRGDEAACYVCLVAFVVASHPLTAVFALGGAFLLIFQEKTATLERKKILLILGMLGAGLSLLWPWYSIWGVVFGNDMNMKVDISRFLQAYGVTGRASYVGEMKRGQYFYDWGQLFLRGEEGLLGGLCALGLLFMRRFRWIGLLFLLMLLPFVANMFLPIPLGHRFVFFCFFSAHMALVACVVLLIEKCVLIRQRRNWLLGRWAICISLLGVLIYPLVTQVEFAAKAFQDRKNEPFDFRYTPSPVVMRFSQLAEKIDENALVMTDVETGFTLPAFTGKVVAPLRGDVFLADRRERNRAVRTFFAPNTPDDIREMILNRYKVTHILIAEKGLSPDILSYIMRIAQEIDVDTTDRLFKIIR